MNHGIQLTRHQIACVLRRIDGQWPPSLHHFSIFTFKSCPSSYLVGDTSMLPCCSSFPIPIEHFGAACTLYVTTALTSSSAGFSAACSSLPVHFKRKIWNGFLIYRPSHYRYCWYIRAVRDPVVLFVTFPLSFLLLLPSSFVLQSLLNLVGYLYFSRHYPFSRELQRSTPVYCSNLVHNIPFISVVVPGDGPPFAVLGCVAFCEIS